MADYKVSDSDLTSVASAIRTKGGTSASLSFPSGFVTAIGNISTGGGSTLITKSITANGTYNASSDSADGYSSVTVTVPSPFVKVYTYTVSSAISEAAKNVILTVMTGYYDSDAVFYLFVINGNTETGSYRGDAMLCSKLASASDVDNAAGILYRNNYASTYSGFGGTIKVSAGATIDLYKMLKPT